MYIRSFLRKPSFPSVSDGLHKHWLFFVIKLGAIMSAYFSTTDINLGMDSSRKFDWITSEGRHCLIYNSTELSDYEKSMLLENST